MRLARTTFATLTATALAVSSLSGAVLAQDAAGNFCDGDFNQDCQVNFVDLAEMREVFFMSGAFDEDMDGNGTVDFFDLAQLKSGFFAPPGPSALANACNAG